MGQKKKEKKKEKFLKGLRKIELQTLAGLLGVKNFSELSNNRLQSLIVNRYSEREIEAAVGIIRVKTQSGEKLLLDFFRQKRWVTEAVILAIIPLAAYVISYIFELGSASFFNIPGKLISIDLKLSFSSIAITVFALFLVYFYIFRFSTEITISEAIKGLYLAIIFTISGIIISRVILIINILDIVKYPLKIYLNSFFLIVPGIVLVLLIYEYRARFLKKEVSVYEIINPLQLTLSRWFKFIKVRRNRGSIEQILLIMVIAQILYLIVFVYCLGVTTASCKKDFFVFEHNKEKSGKEELVVLKKYSDILICVPFDREKKIVFQKFYFMKIVDQQNTRFEVEKIGPLISQELKPVRAKAQVPRTGKR